MDSVSDNLQQLGSTQSAKPAAIRPKQPYVRYLILLVISVVCVEGFLGYNYLKKKGIFSEGSQTRALNQSTEPKSEAPIQTIRSSPTLTPSPTPIQLKAGKETYRVSQGSHAGPTISQIDFDPLDVKKGDKLTLSVTASDTAPVTAVAGTIKTDGSTQSLTFTKISDSGTQSIWNASVVPEYTLWYTYIITVSATSSNGTSTAGVAPRS